MDYLKVGIIGIGNMGSAHLHCISEGNIKGLTAVSVCDINKATLAAAKEKYPNIKAFENYEDLLADNEVDTVIIAVPHILHADIAIKAFMAGKHVLLEKPVDITVTKATALNRAAKISGKQFGIVFNQRTNMLYAKAREIIKSGKLGEIKRSVWIVTNWYRTQHYYDSGSWRATWLGEGGGVLLNQAPHNLDLWQWICGMPKTVTAICNVAKYHDIEVEDEAAIYTTYENGATGVFLTSTGEYPGTNRLEISGTKGKIVIEGQTLKLWSLKLDERDVCYNSNENFASIEKEYIEIKGERETAHRGILQNFANSVLLGEELLAPGYDGINELTISNAAYLSSWNNNKTISIPFDYAEFDRALRARQSYSKLKNQTNNKLSDEYSSRWQVHW